MKWNEKNLTKIKGGVGQGGNAPVLYVKYAVSENQRERERERKRKEKEESFYSRTENEWTNWKKDHNLILDTAKAAKDHTRMVQGMEDDIGDDGGDL